MTVLEIFGFTHLGHVYVTVNDVTFSSSLFQPNPSCLGLFLLSDEALIQVIFETETSPNFCVIDNLYIQSLFTFKDLEISFPRPPWRISKLLTVFKCPDLKLNL